eukprot:GHVN01068257.1.p1 GENE.GHVN01068257.1~~GHVN01068257.1.p1  ORF type:complete len:879 (-),score=222.99 GHVN01068257.1:1062-3404(-)
MEQARARNIRSGWKVLLSIINAAAKDVGDLSVINVPTEHQSHVERTAAEAFQVLLRIIEQHPEVVSDNFNELVRCLISFASTAPTDAKKLPEKAVLSLVNVTHKVTASERGGRQEGEGVEEGKSVKRGSLDLGGKWVSVLTGLARLSTGKDNLQSTRVTSVNSLFDLLVDKAAGVFDSDTWRIVYRGVLFPLFDDIHLHLSHSPQLTQLHPTDGQVATSLTSVKPSPPSGRGPHSSQAPHLGGSGISSGGNERVKTGKPVSVSTTSPASKKHEPHTQTQHIKASEVTGDVSTLVVSMGLPRGEQNRGEWASTICWIALNRLVRQVEAQFHEVEFLLNEVFTLLSGCIVEQTEAIARMGLDALKLCLALIGHKCGADGWVHITSAITHLFNSTTPESLLAVEVSTVTGRAPQQARTNNQHTGPKSPRRVSAPQPAPVSALEQQASSLQPLAKQSQVASSSGSGPSPLPFNSSLVVSQCVVQLLLIDLLYTSLLPMILKGLPSKDGDVDAVQQQNSLTSTTSTPRDKTYSHVGFVGRIPVPALHLLLDALHRSFEFAHSFNKKVTLRHRLKCSGFMREMAQLPGLLKQERQGIMAFVSILFAAIDADGGCGIAPEPTTSPLSSPRSDDPSSSLSTSAPSTSDACHDSFEKRLLVTCRWLGRHYLSREDELRRKGATLGPIPREGPKTFEQLLQVEGEREVAGLTPIIARVVLPGFGKMTNSTLSKHVEEVFALLMDLMLVEPQDVRLGVREVLVKKIGPMMGVNASHLITSIPVQGTIQSME